MMGTSSSHPTVSLFTAYRFQPLKKALYSNQEAKSTLYSNKEPFYAGRARDRGEEPLNPYLLAVLLLQRDRRDFLAPSVQFLNSRLQPARKFLGQAQLIGGARIVAVKMLSDLLQFPILMRQILPMFRSQKRALARQPGGTGINSVALPQREDILRRCEERNVLRPCLNIHESGRRAGKDRTLEGHRIAIHGTPKERLVGIRRILEPRQTVVQRARVIRPLAVHRTLKISPIVIDRPAEIHIAAVTAVIEMHVVRVDRPAEIRPMIGAVAKTCHPRVHAVMEVRLIMINGVIEGYRAGVDGVMEVCLIMVLRTAEIHRAKVR